jgi:hypothetical protein
MPEASSSAPELSTTDLPTGAAVFRAPELSPRRAALHQLADELRALTDILSESTASTEEFEAATVQLHAVRETLEAGGRGRNRLAERITLAAQGEAAAKELSESEYASHPFFDHSMVAGLGNPLAPPVTMEIFDDEVRGYGSYGTAYEGPPGNVHGGWTAAVFDEVLGMVQSLDGRPGMTGRLIVNYKKPTPLHTRIRYEGRTKSVDGRKKWVVGEAYNDETGELLCESEALFISIDFAKFAQLMAARAATDSTTSRT